MPILQAILLVALVGFVLWLVITYIPMPDPFKQVLIAIAVIALVIWFANSFGLFASYNAPLRLR